MCEAQLGPVSLCGLGSQPLFLHLQNGDKHLLVEERKHCHMWGALKRGVQTSPTPSLSNVPKAEMADENVDSEVQSNLHVFRGLRKMRMMRAGEGAGRGAGMGAGWHCSPQNSFSQIVSQVRFP